MNAKIDTLSQEEIKVILRAADEIIAQGGRTLLAKILKGSREKKVLQLELDTCPVYGYYKSEKLDEVVAKIDWMIEYDFLTIEYSGKLPMIVFTERGWQIESDQMADELLQEWMEWVKQGEQSPDMTYLKDRNREMILLLLEKVKESGNKMFIPYLRLWEKIEYKKVKKAIRSTIKALENNVPIDNQLVQNRTESIDEALKGAAPQDLRLKCWECGERFMFTIGEQLFFKQKGFEYPKRCGKCRDNRKPVFF
ncbi:RQC-minor-1 family DNA-binding protein [Aquibacillus salsiterrae]|uniref:Zinc-ribbon domain containing protein n=1 Tax=Aquibacillus salsiterrae TaxID=2950439 RepID=A0A9X4AFW8_9BACI|nr:RQC-minor-1 family DNA-binding protein [Aquibacillus salsiterrae]MDC3418074.1 zinc-ribbon domain containing protein [Aquibacillus salsiterrae]